MSKCAILLVDDEQIVLNSLLLQLRNHFGSKYLYETALSGNEALEVIDELVGCGVNIILIISDWLMPGLRGDAFLEEVHGRYPETVKIILSGQADESAIQSARGKAGLFRYIQKPWDKEHLISIVESGLRKGEQSNEG